MRSETERPPPVVVRLDSASQGRSTTSNGYGPTFVEYGVSGQTVVLCVQPGRPDFQSRNVWPTGGTEADAG